MPWCWPCQTTKKRHRFFSPSLVKKAVPGLVRGWIFVFGGASLEFLELPQFQKYKLDDLLEANRFVNQPG